tara:strand:+ start:1429 stop:1560 length:132 start_codon:yes stop_codon:yes gene_type:complete
MFEAVAGFIKKVVSVINKIIFQKYLFGFLGLFLMLFFTLLNFD